MLRLLRSQDAFYFSKVNFIIQDNFLIFKLNINMYLSLEKINKERRQRNYKSNLLLPNIKDFVPNEPKNTSAPKNKIDSSQDSKVKETDNYFKKISENIKSNNKWIKISTVNIKNLTPIYSNHNFQKQTINLIFQSKDESASNCNKEANELSTDMFLTKLGFHQKKKMPRRISDVHSLLEKIRKTRKKIDYEQSDLQLILQKTKDAHEEILRATKYTRSKWFNLN